jgi:NADH-quinone oxidoreductase subunit G
VTVDAGANLIEAARRLGIIIPHFCYHPGLGVDGNCRMCLVEIEGQPKPAIACNTFARDVKTKDGVRPVYTTSPKVKEWQRAVLEFLFLNHPLDCPICDQSGECFLQDYYMANGQYVSRLDTPKLHKRKVVDVGPRVKLDAERCVLCSRCVRFCDSVTGTGELAIVNRGNRSEITSFPGLPLANDYSLNTVDICPVGALTSSEFRFRKRVWLLSSTASICTGCARGCNIFLEHDEGLVYRCRPRENMEVNSYWMCDAGRQTFHPLNEERLEVPEERGKEIPFFEALARAASWVNEATGFAAGATGGAKSAGGGAIGGSSAGVVADVAFPGVPGGASGGASGGVAGWSPSGGARDGSRVLVLLSPASSVETLFAAKQFAAEFLGGARVAGAGTRPPGVEDKILRNADPYPNTAGLSQLGLAHDPEPDLVTGGKLLVIVEDDALGERQRPAWKQHLARWDRVLYLGVSRNATSAAAHLALPLTPHSECDGTYVNFQQRLQRFRKAITPRGDALWAPDLFRRIGLAADGAAEAGGSFGWPSFNALWRDLAAGEPGFAGVDVTKLGGIGQPLADAASGGPAPREA